MKEYFENKAPKISVIVPVYNTGQYLNRCVDSILSQTFTDIEVLLINDGSTDSSGVICNNYAKKDNRVRVFHKENGGVSSARNVGICSMLGEYSIHVDSDDWVDVNYLEKLYSKASKTNADIVWCDFIQVGSSRKYYIKQDIQSCFYEIISSLLLGKMHGSNWNKLVRSQIIKDNNIGFVSQIGLHEDLLFTLDCFLHAESYSYVNEGLYFYAKNNNSITSSPLTNQKIKNKELVIDILLEKLDSYCFFSKEILTFKCLLKIELLVSNEVSLEQWREVIPLSKLDILYSYLPLKFKILFLLRSIPFFCKVIPLFYNYFKV